MPGTSEQRDGIKARTEFLFYLCVSTLVVNNCAKFSASGDAQCVQTIQIYYGPRSNVDVLKHFRALFPIIVCAVVRVWPNISRLSAKHGCKILSKQSIVFFGKLGWPVDGYTIMSHDSPICKSANKILQMSKSASRDSSPSPRQYRARLWKPWRVFANSRARTSFSTVSTAGSCARRASFL